MNELLKDLGFIEMSIQELTEQLNLFTARKGYIIQQIKDFQHNADQSLHTPERQPDGIGTESETN